MLGIFIANWLKDVERFGMSPTYPKDASGITLDQFKACFPNAPQETVSSWYWVLIGRMVQDDINTPTRAAAFFAQIGWECGEFRFLEEKTDGRYLELRSDLGNTNPGDGFKYRGRGIIQLTGRANYRYFGNKLGVDLEAEPELATDLFIASAVACAYWNEHGLSELADQNTRNAFAEITRRINGGYTHLEQRLSMWIKAQEVLGCLHRNH